MRLSRLSNILDSRVAPYACALLRILRGNCNFTQRETECLVKFEREASLSLSRRFKDESCRVEGRARLLSSMLGSISHHVILINKPGY